MLVSLHALPQFSLIQSSRQPSDVALFPLHLTRRTLGHRQAGSPAWVTPLTTGGGGGRGVEPRQPGSVAPSPPPFSGGNRGNSFVLGLSENPRSSKGRDTTQRWLCLLSPGFITYSQQPWQMKKLRFQVSESSKGIVCPSEGSGLLIMTLEPAHAFLQPLPPWS